MDEPFDQEHDDTYELMVPFVVCASQGGPFDDNSFVAGFEVGEFCARLRVAAALDLFPFTFTVHRANMRQLDLFVMHARLQMREEKMDANEFDEAAMAEWAMVTVDHG